jgi:hypothetical protein
MKALKTNYSELSRAPEYLNITKRNKVVLSAHQSPIGFLFYDFKIRFSAYGESLPFYRLCCFSRISFFIFILFFVTKSDFCLADVVPMRSKCLGAIKDQGEVWWIRWIYHPFFVLEFKISKILITKFTTRKKFAIYCYFNFIFYFSIYRQNVLNFLYLQSIYEFSTFSIGLMFHKKIKIKMQRKLENLGAREMREEEEA